MSQLAWREQCLDTCKSPAGQMTTSLGRPDVRQSQDQCWVREPERTVTAHDRFCPSAGRRVSSRKLNAYRGLEFCSDS